MAYGVLFEDPKVEQYYEALMGTLKAAKKKGVVSFEGQMLLKGAHDNVNPPPTRRTARDCEGTG